MIQSEIARHSRRSLLIDTNIFLLVVIGKVDKRLIPAFKRTNTFSVDDYERLLNVLSFFERLIVTPNILTEVSNLLGQLSEPKRSQALAVLGLLTTGLVEIYVPSESVAESEALISYGLTDSTIIDCASHGALTLTDDFALYGRLIAAGQEAINFNHLRAL